MVGFTEPIPLSLYVHLPWCVRKCPYCDFNSHATDGPLPEDEYVSALILDLESELPHIWGRRIESVFIGGGTPSLFSAKALDTLLDALRARLPLRPDLEITLEANPGTFEQARFADYRQLGINRLSIGVQSFDEDALKRLGRIHGGTEARRAAEIAYAAGFDDFNLDLMFGLPGQTLASAAHDIETALSFAPTHLSYYQLTLEPNTLFHVNRPVLPDEELIAEMHSSAQSRLANRGYSQYEVSAYALAGRPCRHNLNYWNFGDYVGIGAGAHGKITQPSNGTITRRWKFRQPAQYMEAARKGAPAGGESLINSDERAFEFMLNALRLREGFTLSLFEQRTGLPRAQIQNTLQTALERNLIEYEGGRVHPSPLGWDFLNDLMGLFLP